jgi:hypothetical protein
MDQSEGWEECNATNKETGEKNIFHASALKTCQGLMK